MTIQMAAKRLGKSESTIRRWIREGKLTATKVDKVWDIPEEAVDSYASDQSTGGGMEVILQQLRNENEYLKERIQELESARERADTISLQLTRQADQSKRLLEYRSESRLRRWLRERRERRG